MDEGLPISWAVLEEGVPVYTSERTVIGTVEHVVASSALDIFHGIVIRTAGGSRFVAADDVADLHERGVHLNLDAAAASALREPSGGAPALRVSDPAKAPSRWRRILDDLEGVAPTRRDWTDED